MGQLMGFFGIAGGMIGGFVSDGLNKVIGPRARPLTAVISVSLAIPTLGYLYLGIAPQDLNVINFSVIMIIFNLVSPWPQPGCNFPVMGQIVTGENRNKIICWEMAFENSMSVILGSNLPYFLSLLLGYDKVEAESYPDYEKADQLRILQSLATLGPWTICFCVYITLMWAFPIDLKNLEDEKARKLTTPGGTEVS